MKKINSNNHLLVPSWRYDMEKDKRFLIPFKEGTKFGFTNKQRQIIIPPIFDIILDDFRFEDSIVRVGKFTTKINEHKSTPPSVTLMPIFGLLKADGTFIVPIEYEGIAFPDISGCFTIRSLSKGYSVIDSKGNTIIPFGKYNYIDGFYLGLARVKVGGGNNGLNDSNSLWGLIDEQGNEKLKPIYSYIWPFYNKNSKIAKLKQTDNKELEFNLIDGSIHYSGYQRDKDAEFEENMKNYDSLKEYRENTYDEFNGSYAQDVMGFSDQDINDAFDGDPDAYWNID